MTKVKILSSYWADVLERMINDFASNHEVLSIKFSTCCASLNSTTFSALIMYEED